MYVSFTARSSISDCISFAACSHVNAVVSFAECSRVFGFSGIVVVSVIEVALCVGF